MLRIDISGRSAAEIASSVEQGIRGGKYQPGDRLPPVRELARHLGTSPVTVAAAYRVLRARGLTAGAGRRGTRVVPNPAVPTGVRSVSATNGVDLASGNPDPALLPSLDTAIHSVSVEPQLCGEPLRLRALTAFLLSEFEADALPLGAVAVVGGALDGVERVVREHLRAGDVVAVEDPSFPGLLDLLTSVGLELAPYTIDDHGPEPAAFERAARRAAAIVVTPRAQNPTGGALTAERASELRKILGKRRDVLLIENDPLGPVSGAPATTLAGAGSNHWAVLRSTSKFLGPDLRFAAMLGDEITIARVQGRQSLGTRWVSTILQQLVLALWSDPANGRLLARAAEIYTHRRNALRTALAARGVTVSASSGFNVWIPVQAEVPVVQALAEKGWAVTAGERFRLQTPPAIRVTVSTLEPVDAARFAGDLKEVMMPAATRFA